MAMPALFTRPASPASPTAPETASAAAAIDAASVTSMNKGVSRSDALRFNASASACLRIPAKIWNPLRSSSKAHASPIPVDAPVTTTAPPGAV